MSRAALALALLLAAAGVAAAAPEEKPFPVARSAILREGGIVYVVTGTLTIPKGVDIACQKNVHIVGRGGTPTIRVEGTLKVHGVGLREVIFEGVTIELAPTFRDVQIDMAIFRNGGGIRTSADGPSVGKLFIELVTLKDAADIDLTFKSGSIDLSSVTCGSSVSITAHRGEDGGVGKLRLNVRGSDLGDLSVRNASQVTVRLSRLAGGVAAFHDCRALELDGLKVNAGEISITHRKAGGLTKTKITNSDIYSDRISVRTPLKSGRIGDKVLIDRCWFRNVVDRRVLREKLIQDAEDDPKNGARVLIGKIQADPTELGGPVDR